MTTKKRIIENATVSSDISQSQAAIAVTSSATSTLSVDSIAAPTATPSAPAITGVFDSVGERVGLRGSNSSTDDTRPTVQGIAEPNSVVTIRNNGVVLGSAQANASGEWSFTPITDLSPGDYNLRVSDSFQQLSELFVVRVLAPGEAAPEVFITFYHDDFGAQKGYFHNGTSTDDARPTFSGVAQDNAVITIYDGDQVIGSTQANARGSWQFTPLHDLSVGTHSFTATDASGQRSASFDVHIQDPTLGPDPRPSINSVFDNVGSTQGNLGNGSSTDDNLPVLSGHGKPNSVLNVYAGGVYQGVANVDGNGIWSFSFNQPLSEGHQIFTVVNVADDLVSADFNLHITLPALPPPPTIESVFDNVGASQGHLLNGASTDDLRPQLLGKGHPNSDMHIFDNGNYLKSVKVDSNGNWSLSILKDLDGGTHNFTVVNAAGQSSQPFVLNVVAAPALPPTIESVYDNVGTSQGLLFNGASTDDLRPQLLGKGAPNSELHIFDNGNYLTSVRVDNNGNWSLNILQDLNGGTHSFTLVNAAGQSSQPFVLNVVAAPALPPTIEAVYDNVGTSQGHLFNGASTDDLRPQLLGKGAPNSELHIFDNGNYLTSVRVDSNGNWSLNILQDLNGGAHSFTLVNAAGQSSQPFVLNVVAAPALPPTIESVYDNVGTSQGLLFNGASTDDLRPQLLGKGAPNSELHIFDNGSYLSSVKIDSNGNWSLSLFKDLSSGTHNFTVVNATGQSSQPFELNVVAAPAPAPSIVSAQDNVGGEQGLLASGANTDDARPGLYGAGKPNSIITIYDGEQIIGSTTSNFKGEWYFSPRSDLPLGDHHFIAVDSAGERSETFSLTVEGQAPYIRYFEDNVGFETGLFGDGDTTDDARPTFGGSGIPNSLITFYSGDQAIGSAQVKANGQWFFTPEQPLSEGNHSISALGSNGLVSSTLDLTVTPLTDVNSPLGLALSDVLSDTSEHFFASAEPEVSSGLSVPALEFDAQSFAQDGALSSTPAADYGLAAHAKLTMVNLMEQVEPHQPMI